MAQRTSLLLTDILEEPIASEPDGNGEWGQVQLLASVAISLKRIADALDNQSPKGSVLHWLEIIASAANASVGR